MKAMIATSFLVAAALHAPSGMANAAKQDLVEIDRGEDYRGVGYIVSADRASRKTGADGVTITVHNVAAKVREDGSTDVVTDYLVDCAMPQYKVVRKYRADAAGKILGEETIDRMNGGSWTYAKRPGMPERLVAAACTG